MLKSAWFLRCPRSHIGHPRHAYGFGNALPTSKAPPGPEPWVPTALLGLQLRIYHQKWTIVWGFNMNYLQANILGKNWRLIESIVIANKVGGFTCRFWSWDASWGFQIQAGKSRKSLVTSLAKAWRCTDLGMLFVKSRTRYPLVNVYIAIESIVDLPIEHGDFPQWC